MDNNRKRVALLGATAALAIAVGTAQAQTTGAEGFGDFVWADLNLNGIQDAGEPGIPGVTVNLYRDGPFFVTGITNASGLYFLEIGSGAVSSDWVVQFVLPSGFQFSPADQGNDALDSDVVDALTGRTAVIPGFTFASFPEGPNPTVDAGMFLRTTVPEPGALSLIAAALVGLAGCAGIRRRFSRTE